MSDRSPSMSELESALRRALEAEAQEITPTDRFEQIRALTTIEPPRRGFRPGWFLSLSAAAAAAVLATVTWLAWSPDDSRVAPGGPSTPPIASSPSTTGGSTSPSSPSTAATAPVALPVYYVGPVEENRAVRWALYRDFTSVSLPTPVTPDAKVSAAVKLALHPGPLSNQAGYLQPWSSVGLDSVSYTPTLITVNLAAPGPTAGFTPAQQQLAIQQLVWTAQAASGQRIPVTFTIADGSTKLFGSIPADVHYDRPPTSQLADVVAPIWISSPSRDQVIRTGTDVKVTGVAMVTEGALAWELTTGTTVVDSGSVSAAAGAPAQSEYAIDLGTLTAGDYAITVWHPSDKDGSRFAPVNTTFSIK